MRQIVKSPQSAGHSTAIPAGWRQPARRLADPSSTRVGAEDGATEAPDVLLERRVRGAIEQSVSHKRTVAVVFIDLDTADADDRRETETLLRTRLRRYDMVIGLEGSHIAICLGHLRNASELAGVMERVDEIISAERFRRTWGTPRIGAAIHAAGGTAPQLIEAARAALAAPGRA